MGPNLIMQARSDFQDDDTYTHTFYPLCAELYGSLAFLVFIVRSFVHSFHHAYVLLPWNGIFNLVLKMGVIL